jgi:uncharacterized protein YqjF (DUF2071 family)
MTKPDLDKRMALRERPDRTPVMFQNWRDLLFIHWEIDAETIQRTLPAGLQVDTFQDRAYIGIVPFFMKDVRPNFLPAVPGISDFMEVNVRTYVYDRAGSPGVWFYSLDANQWLAVKTARWTYSLPYFYADMRAQFDADNTIDYHSHRHGADSASHFQYRGSLTTRRAEPDTLEFFLLERYLLFAHSASNGKLYSGRVYHTPYPIVDAEVARWDDHLLSLNGFASPGRMPDNILMSPGVEVEIFALEALG